MENKKQNKETGLSELLYIARHGKKYDLEFKKWLRNAMKKIRGYS